MTHTDSLNGLVYAGRSSIAWITEAVVILAVDIKAAKIIVFLMVCSLVVESK